MNDEKLLNEQILNAYHDGKIDFENVTIFEEIVTEQVQREFKKYQSAIQAKANADLENTLLEIKQHVHQEMDITQLKQDFMLELKQQQELNHSLEQRIITEREAFETSSKKLNFEKWGLFLANIVCLLAMLLVCVLFGKWIVQGVWNGWGLHLLFDTVVKMRPEHPYGALVLGVVGFVLITLAIVGSFRLMYYTSSQWLYKQPLSKLFKKKFSRRRF